MWVPLSGMMSLLFSPFGDSAWVGPGIRSLIYWTVFCSRWRRNRRCALLQVPHLGSRSPRLFSANLWLYSDVTEKLSETAGSCDHGRVPPQGSSNFLLWQHKTLLPPIWIDTLKQTGGLLSLLTTQELHPKIRGRAAWQQQGASQTWQCNIVHIWYYIWTTVTNSYLHTGRVNWWGAHEWLNILTDYLISGQSSPIWLNSQPSCNTEIVFKTVDFDGEQVGLTTKRSQDQYNWTVQLLAKLNVLQHLAPYKCH